MSTGFVNIHGEPIEQFAVHARPLKPRREGSAEYHKGWIVEGHAPGSMEKAQEEKAIELREWADRTSDEKVGMKAPKPWSEEYWHANGKLTRVRQKAFEIASSAYQLKEMAEKQGWCDVRVRELAKKAL